jgi:DNA end-binding protein Ku
VGIGRFTFHNREYLAAVRALDDVLALHTMRFHDEIVRGKDLDVDTPGKGAAKKEVEMASQLVDSLHREFDPTDYEDSYREAVLKLIERKAKGEEVDLEEEEPEEETSDLMAALQASLKGS